MEAIRPLKVTKDSTNLIVSVATLCVVAIAALLAWWSYEREESRWREELGQATEEIGSALDPERIDVTWNSVDSEIGRAEERLSRQLRTLPGAYRDCRFVYLFVPHPDGVFRSLVIEDSAIGKSRGLDSLLRKASQSRNAILIEQGLFDGVGEVVGLKAIYSRDKDAAVAVVVVRFHPEGRAKQLILAALPAMVCGTCLVLLLVAWPISQALRRRRARNLRGEAFELAVFVFLFGAILTMFSWVSLHRSQAAERMERERLHAKEATTEVVENLRTIHDAEMESLAGFYLGQDTVRSDEFHRFAAFLSRRKTVFLWAWVSPVTTLERTRMEFGLRGRTGDPRLGIWRWADARRVPAPSTPVLYPVVEATPLTEHLDKLGWDMSSEPEYAAAIREAIRTQRPTSTGLVIQHDSAKSRSLVFFRPLFDQRQPGKTKGFAVAAVRVEDLLGRELRDDRMVLRLDILHEGGVFERMGETGPCDSTARGWFAMPFLGFDKVFVVSAHLADGIGGDRTDSADLALLATGLSLSFLIALLLYIFHTRRGVLEGVVHQQAEVSRALEQRLTWALDATGDGVWDWNIVSSRVVHNRRWCEILGLDDAFLEHPLESFSECVYEEDRQGVFERVNACLEGKGVYGSVHRMLHKDGSIVWVHDRGDVVERDAGGAPLRMVGSMADITERKLAEDALREEEARRRMAMDLSRIAHWEFDYATQRFHFNEQYYSMYRTSYAKEGSWSMGAEEWSNRFLTASAHPIIQENLGRSMASPEAKTTCQYEHETKVDDGEIRMVSVRFTLEKDAFGNPVRMFGATQDITEQKIVEAALRASEAKRVLGMDLARIASWEFDMKSGEFLFDKQFYALHGSPPDLEGVERLPAEGYVSRFVHPDDIEKVVDAIKNALEGNDVGRMHSLEHRARKADGTDMFVAVQWVLLRDAEGRPYRSLGVTQDITERRKAELELETMNRYLEEATAKATSLAAQAEMASVAKSEFLANMSHEIRTPLNGIIGMTGLLLGTTLNERQRHHAEVVRQSGEALLALLNDILDLSKIEAGRLEMETIDFDLGLVMEDFASVLALKASEKGIELLCGLEPGLPQALRGDPGRLRQILINLAGNAVKFTSRGEVEVTVSVVEESEAEVLLRFSVRDTGIGIPPDKLDTLFQKFVQIDASTARQYGGTGLGLAISRQLAEMMGGEIGLESVLGGGSTFWFTARFAQRREASATPDLPARMAGTRILVVEPNTTGRRLLLERLSGWGLSPQPADSPLEALRLLREASAAGKAYAATLVGWLHDGADALEFARTVRDIPGVATTRIALMPPFAQGIDSAALAEAGVCVLVPKPIRASLLRRGLLNLLDVDAGGEDGSLLAAEKGREGMPPTFSSKSRLLLVEDNSVNQMVALGILEIMGLRADVAGNGVEALEALRTIPYDLVLMDVQMPEMDGYEATRRLRAPNSTALNPRIPIVAMTANAMRGDRELCLEAGMDAYVAKPVEAHELARVLARWIPFASEAPTVAPGVISGAEAGPSVFDRANLLKRLLGNVQLVERIVGQFASSTPPEIDLLGEKVDRGDLDEAARSAHQVRGAALNVGAMALAASLSRLEELCRRGETDHVRQEMERVRDEISQWTAEALRSSET